MRFPLLAAAALLAFACAAPQPAVDNRPEAAKLAASLNLDSLGVSLGHKDSVESNHFFYEESYTVYRQRYPGVEKSAYLRVAAGKDREFCLFQPDPARTCVDNGDRFNDLQLKQPALDAYEAGLLSEGYNDTAVNVRLWGSMGQLAVESKDLDAGRMYFRKILEVDPGNKWAKKQLSTLK